MIKSFLRLLTELSSRKFLSRTAGQLAKSGWSRRLIPRFAKTYGIAVEEAEKALGEYQSLNEFFTRRLKPGARLLDSRPDALISPVDALITGMGSMDEGHIRDVKGQDYTLQELLNRSPRAVTYKKGYYFVLYLSPTDYHRIHSPVDGTILEKEHVPGRVYPVNEFGLRHMTGVLSRNERLITYIQHDNGEVAVVKVGAMNVSSIQYAELSSDRLQRGQELAYFEFGSTVVLLTEQGTFEPSSDLSLGARVRMGQALGMLHKKPPRGGKPVLPPDSGKSE